MDTESKLAILQNTYAAALAEAVNTYAKLNLLESIVDRKKSAQPQTAAYMNRQLGITCVEDVFTTLSGVFGCANWTVEQTETGFLATATACKLCALSKRMGGANPCRGWCLDPMSAMITAVSDDSITNEKIKVICTLMDSDCCKVEVIK